MRVGLVGCGRWGTHILRDLRTLGCEVRVVARSPAGIDRANAAGAAEVVATVDHLAGVEGIVVATTTSTHADVVRCALGLQVPVFVEKPLCSDAGDAAQLACLAPDRLFVMDKWRYHPGVQAIAEIARSGTLGRPCGLKTTRIEWGSPHADVDCAWHLAPHDLAIALEVFERHLLPVAATAQLVDGRAVSLVGVLRDNTFWHVLDISERSPVRVRRVELHCDHGVAVLDGGWSDYITVYSTSDGGRMHEERVETPGELPLLAELRQFVTHLRGGSPPRSRAADGACVVGTIAQLRSLAGVGG